MNKRIKNKNNFLIAGDSNSSRIKILKILNKMSKVSPVIFKIKE
jgi:hypothetical protein